MPTYPVVAARPAAALLDCAPVAGTVRAVHSSAVLVELPDRRVLSLVSPGGCRTPNAVALPEVFRGRHAVRIGDPVLAGSRELQGRCWRLLVRRSWNAELSKIDISAESVGLLAEAARTAVRGVPDEPVDELRAALARTDPNAAVRAAAVGLLGLGAGSTPGGDDVLAGAMVGLQAVGRANRAALLFAAVRNRLHRTTALSAELLCLAAAGAASTEVLAVLRAADRRAGSIAALHRALAGLLAVGSTSGADLATGLGIGLAAGRQD